MKNFSLIALSFVLTAGLLTACRAPSMDETTAPGTDYSTAPTNTPTTAPTTTPTTTPSIPTTIPVPTGPSDATENSGGINSMDPSEGITGKHGMMPHNGGMR